MAYPSIRQLMTIHDASVIGNTCVAPEFPRGLYRCEDF